jgi:hypothetical protein
VTVRIGISDGPLRRYFWLSIIGQKDRGISLGVSITLYSEFR